MTLTLPADLQSQVEALAQQRGTDAQTIVIEATRAAVGKAANGGATSVPSLNGGGAIGSAVANSGETREERRARINAAIDAAQADFVPISRVFGDPVNQLMADKRADEERARERGL